jgi:uncharacterized protein YoxC
MCVRRSAIQGILESVFFPRVRYVSATGALMTINFAPHVLPLLPQTATLPDTIVTRQITERGWLETLVSIEQAIVGLAMLALLGVTVMMLLSLRKGLAELTKLVQSSIGDLSGAAHSVRNVADDVRSVTHTLRDDVTAVGETVRTVNELVRDAVDDAEYRVRRLGSLMDVAQEEAEDFVVSAASTMRGVAEGASALRHGFAFFGQRRRPPVRHPARRPRREDETPRGNGRGPRVRHRTPREA